MKFLAIALLSLFAGAAFADGAIITTTVSPADWVLKTKDLRIVSRGYQTEEACAAAIVIAGDYRCDRTVAVKAVGSCKSEAPDWPLKINAEGFVERPGLVVEAQPDGSWGPTMEQGYVLEPYPRCWVMGLVPYTGKWQAPDLGSVHEPVYRPGEEPKP